MACVGCHSFWHYDHLELSTFQKLNPIGIGTDWDHVNRCFAHDQLATLGRLLVLSGLLLVARCVRAIQDLDFNAFVNLAPKQFQEISAARL